MQLQRASFVMSLLTTGALLATWLGTSWAAEPRGLAGIWKVDLRPTPDAEAYDQKMVIVEGPDGGLTGTFYGSKIQDLTVNSDWGDLQFAFITEDGSGLYATSGVLRANRIEGRTHSQGREFLSVWTAERVPDTSRGLLLDEVVSDYFDAGQFEGTVLVAEAGNVILEKGYGRANRDWGAPNGPDTRFLIASVTKQFTALLIMQMVGEGAIDLDAPIGDYLPYYRKDTGRAITVRQLLQHTSGLPEGVVEFDQYDDAITLTGNRPEFVRRFWMGDPAFPPGTDFSYTNTDYGLLGAILEEVTGSTYEDLLQRRILSPLAMEDSGLVGFGTYVPGLATGYLKTADAAEIRPYLGQPGYAAAGMYSTARDLFRWNQALLEHALLSPELTTTMFTPIVGINPTTGNYVAFGSWVYERQLPDDRTIRLIERHGYISPFTSLNVIAPDHGHSIIILSNVDPADIHGLPYAPGLPYDLLLTLVGLPAQGAPLKEETVPAAMEGFSWIVDGELAAMPLPGRNRSLSEDVEFLEHEGVRTVISLTETAPPLETTSIRQTHIPIEDFTAPTLDQMIEFVDAATESTGRGEPVAVHCAAGLGRSGTMAAVYLVAKGTSADEAIARVRELRPGSIETEAQVEAVRLAEAHFSLDR